MVSSSAGPSNRTAMVVLDESEIYPMSCLLVVHVYGEGVAGRPESPRKLLWPFIAPIE